MSKIVFKVNGKKDDEDDERQVSPDAPSRGSAEEESAAASAAAVADGGAVSDKSDIKSENKDGEFDKEKIIKFKIIGKYQSDNVCAAGCFRKTASC